MRAARHDGRAAHRTILRADLDRLELRAVRLVDAERAAADVAVRVEANAEAEQRLLDLRLLDQPTNLRAAGRAVLARLVDRAADDLRGDVRRSAEELAVTAVRLLVGQDRLVLRVDREERVVRPVDRGERRVEEAVRAHQLDARP